MIHQKQWWGGEIQRFLEFSPRNLGKWSSLTGIIFQKGLKPPPWMSKISKMAKFQHSGLSGVSLKLDICLKKRNGYVITTRSCAKNHPGPPTFTPIARCHGRCIRHPKRCWTMARWSIRCPGRIRGFGEKVGWDSMFFSGWYPWCFR